jgi:hypothetical protein
MRYTVPGVPPSAAKGSTAFTPHMTRLAASGAQSYKATVSGQPGTEAIPAPRSQAYAGLDRAAVAQKGLYDSGDAPAVWYPSVYYSRPVNWPGAGMPIRVYDPTDPGLTTVVPVPAVGGRGYRLKKSATLAAGISRRGWRQIFQPARQISHPGWQ